MELKDLLVGNKDDRYFSNHFFPVVFLEVFFFWIFIFCKLVDF